MGFYITTVRIELTSPELTHTATPMRKQGITQGLFDSKVLIFSAIDLEKLTQAHYHMLAIQKHHRI